MDDNLFSEKIDAGFYIFTYIFFPIATAYVGLLTLGDTAESLVYWYLTVLCNAVCCLHDCTNRWDKDKPRKNGKIFIMGFCVLITIMYSLFEAICLLNKIEARFDYFLLLYLLNVFIATLDIFELFLQSVCFKQKI